MPEEVNVGSFESRTWAATLPPPPQIFFGRNKDKTALVDALTRGPGRRARLAVLGAPGIGKTSVALSAAHDPRVIADYGDRRVFVQCDSALQSGALLPLIGSSLGINEQVASKLRAAITDTLSTSSALLILDNYESPWEPLPSRPGSEELLGSLTAIESLTFVVTMRGTERPLGVQWTRPFLPPLEHLSHESAMQTFVAISGVSEDDPNLKMLMDAVDRLPLAITLMANMAQNQLESCSSLVSRWYEMHTTMLQRGNSTRLSSVDVSIQLSLSSDRMQSSPGAQELLSALSLLPEGVGLDDLATMLPVLATVRRCISVLLGTALAYKLPANRIRVLAPIRSFMLEHYPPSPATLDGILRHTIAQTRYLQGFHRSSDAIVVKARLEVDGANYEAILRYSLEHGADIGATIVSLTDLVHIMAAFQPVTLDGIEEGLAKARSCGSKSLQARCLRRIARITAMQDYDFDPIPSLHSALSLATDAHDSVEEIDCLLELGRPRLVGGWNETQAHAYALRAAALAREAGEAAQEASASQILGEIAYCQGDHQQAQDHLHRAMDLLNACPKTDLYEVCETARMLADIAGCSGDLRRSADMFERAISTATQLGLHSPLIALKIHLGYVELVRSNITAAILHLESGVELNKLHRRILMGDGWLFLAQAHLALDDQDKAMAVLEDARRALSLSHRSDGQLAKTPNDAFVARGMGHVELHGGFCDAARVFYKQAQEIFGHLYPFLTAELLFDVAETWLKQGEPELARSHYIQAALLNRKLNERVCLLYALGSMADTYLAEGDLATASALTLAVLPRLTWSDITRCRADCHVRLARIAVAGRDRAEASIEAAKAEALYKRGSDKRGAKRCEELLTEAGRQWDSVS